MGEYDKEIEMYKKCLEDPEYFINNCVCFLDKDSKPKPYRDVKLPPIIDYDGGIPINPHIDLRRIGEIEKHMKELIREHNITFITKN